jgi:hypothetical protein
MSDSARELRVDPAPRAAPAPSDLKGQVAGANWRYLLPDLRLGRVLCVGLPSVTTIRSLAQFGDHVTILRKRPAHARRTNQYAARKELTNVDAISLSGLRATPIAEGSVDVVLATSTRAGRQLWSNPSLKADLRHWMTTEGLLYVEFQSLYDADSRAFIESFQEYRPLWLAPPDGEARAAAPLADRTTIDYVLGQGVVRHNHAYRRLFGGRRPVPTGRRLFKRSAARLGALVGPRELDLDRPPRYLCALARSAGIEIDDYRWGLLASGDYNQKKVLVFLFERHSKTPQYVVKMTRHPAYNRRLENEWRALTLLSDQPIDEWYTLPNPAFFGVENEIAILGQTAVSGAPLRRVSKGAADCPHAGAVLDGLVKLGAATAHRSPDGSQQAARSLDALLEQFSLKYRPPHGQQDFLAKQIDAIRREGADLPLVFAHGDAGTWNVLVTAEDRVAILDWEAFDHHGMPLWDLFYFARSHMVLASRSSGTHNALKAFNRYGLADSAHSKLLAEIVARFCDATGLSRTMVEPLWHMCWMHRAVKESLRTPSNRLRRAHYANLVRLSIERRDAPGLVRLFSPGQS